MATTQEKIQAILENAQVIAATQKEIEKREILAGVYAKSGKEGVKAITGIEAAQKRLDAQISKSREAEFAVRVETSTEAVQDQRVHIDALRGRMNLLNEGLGKAGSAAAQLGPEFGGLAQGMQKAGSAAAALLTSVSAFGGPAGIALGVALAAATAAWGAHAEQVAENEKALKDAKEEAEKTAGVFNQLADDLFEATLQQKVLNKELTQAEADIQKAAHGINEAYGPALEGLTERIDAAKVARTKALADEEKAILSNARTMEAAGEQGRQNIDAERKAREDADRELEAAYEAYDRLQASMNNLGTVQTDVIVKTAKQKKEVKEVKEEVEQLATAEEMYYDQRIEYLAQVAAKEETDAAAKEAQAKVDEQAGLDREARILHDLELMEEQAKKEEELYLARLQQVQDIAGSAKTVTNSIASLVDSVYEDHVDTYDALQEDYEQAIEDGDKAQEKSLKKQMEAEEEAALKTFKINKALTITSASLSTIAATAKALEAGWPALLITVPAALAAGGAQIALAAKQKPPEFDDTMQPMQVHAGQGENRANVSLKDKDIMVAAQTPAGLKRQVDRMGGGEQKQTTAEYMNGRLTLRTMTRDLDLVMGRA